MWVGVRRAGQQKLGDRERCRAVGSPKGGPKGGAQSDMWPWQGRGLGQTPSLTSCELVGKSVTSLNSLPQQWSGAKPPHVGLL